jgi:carbamoyl-phosphate synthase small subunit
MTAAGIDHSPARLALESGAVFHGRAFGSTGPSANQVGEVVFNTAMCGYQEALTDPSYAGQILTMTTPQVGNYGVCAEDVESAGPQVAGFVVRELARLRSNYRSCDDVSSWLAAHGVVGIEGVDTRAIVRLLRRDGAMRGVISHDPTPSDAELIEQARRSEMMSGLDLACTVSPRSALDWNGGLGEWRPAVLPPPDAARAERWRVMAIDCGGKHNIYRHLTDRGCAVHRVPHDSTPEVIRACAPDGLFISNGPGDPAAVARTIELLRLLLADEPCLPTFGICLGHQLLALALGARTFKLKFGHRGANQPVRNLLTGRVEITSQNHGFAVDPETLASVGAEATHVHLNDGTLAGFRHLRQPVFAVQYHPEASPGPHDSGYLFDCFVELMRNRGVLDRDTVVRAMRLEPAG